MINVHQAVEAVRAHLGQLTDLIQAEDLRLEEFDIDEHAGEWIITVSFADNALGAMSGNRIYKTFYVNGTTGSVKSMKIRNPYAPA